MSTEQQPGSSKRVESIPLKLNQSKTKNVFKHKRMCKQAIHYQWRILQKVETLRAAYLWEELIQRYDTIMFFTTSNRYIAVPHDLRLAAIESLYQLRSFTEDPGTSPPWIASLDSLEYDTEKVIEELEKCITQQYAQSLTI